MLLKILIAFWASIAVTLYWLEYLRGPARFKWFNRKPFNCEACLPVWLFAVFFHLAIYTCNHVAFIACAFTAGIVTPMILKLIRR